MSVTERLVPAYVQHIDECDVCGDEDIRAEARQVAARVASGAAETAGDLPAEEIEDYVLITHTSRI